MRNVKIYTGVGGYNLFEEAMERHIGFERVYIGKKVPRILRKVHKDIRKSITGLFFFRRKIN